MPIIVSVGHTMELVCSLCALKLATHLSKRRTRTSLELPSKSTCLLNTVAKKKHEINEFMINNKKIAGDTVRLERLELVRVECRDGPAKNPPKSKER